MIDVFRRKILVESIGSDRLVVVGIGGRYPELSPAIRLDPSLLHVFGYGVSAALDALLNDLAMHPRTSVEIKMFLQTTERWN